MSSPHVPGRWPGPLLVGITGSVGAVAMPQFVVHLRRHFLTEVRVLMSAAACRFVTPYAMQLHSGRPVFTDMFETGDDLLVPHIEATRRARVFVVMPATAHTLAKAALGLCDDIVSATLLAAACPVLLVPAMNAAMWENPAVGSNVARLRAMGHTVLEPVEGLEIADLAPTRGCMPAFAVVVEEIARLALGRGDATSAGSPVRSGAPPSDEAHVERHPQGFPHHRRRPVAG